MAAAAITAGVTLFTAIAPEIVKLISDLHAQSAATGIPVAQLGAYVTSIAAATQTTAEGVIALAQTPTVPDKPPAPATPPA